MFRFSPAKITLVAALLAAGIFLFTRLVKNENAGEHLPEVVSFNFHIRPILSDRCFKCHGPDENKREAGLRLDTQEGAFAALGEAKDHYAIVPGDPARSTLVRRIYSTHPDSVMPSPDSHLTLSEFEKKLLKRWIEQGAKWEKHWAFITPEMPALPEVKNREWAKNEIDLFILQKQQEHGLPPSEEAGKERLLRRVSFDLTGLPPSPEMLSNFLNDNSPEAYEKAVDALLASPAYGERWAPFRSAAAWHLWRLLDTQTPEQSKI